MVPIQLLVPFLASELHMAGILDNNNISPVQVRDVVRLVLALHREPQGAPGGGSEGADMPVLEACLEQHCYARSQASHHLLLSIN